MYSEIYFKELAHVIVELASQQFVGQAAGWKLRGGAAVFSQNFFSGKPQVLL